MNKGSSRSGWGWPRNTGNASAPRIGRLGSNIGCRLRGLILCSLVLVAVSIRVPRPAWAGPPASSAAAELKAPTPDPVKDCPPKLICFTLKEQAGIDKRLAELDKLKKTKHILGWHLGCGPVIGGVVDKDFHTRAVPAFGCGALFGW